MVTLNLLLAAILSLSDASRIAPIPQTEHQSVGIAGYLAQSSSGLQMVTSSCWAIDSYYTDPAWSLQHPLDVGHILLVPYDTFRHNTVPFLHCSFSGAEFDAPIIMSSQTLGYMYLRAPNSIRLTTVQTGQLSRTRFLFCEAIESADMAAPHQSYGTLTKPGPCHLDDPIDSSTITRIGLSFIGYSTLGSPNGTAIFSNGKLVAISIARQFGQSNSLLAIPLAALPSNYS